MSQSIKLLPFQVGASNAAFHKKKMLINLPAGSGKSLVALKVAELAESKRVLIVCPAFLRLNWEYEIKKWYPSAAVYVIHSLEEALDTKNTAEGFFVVGYSYFQKKQSKKAKKKLKSTDEARALQKQRWDLVICDESQHLRKWESQRCRDIILLICRLRDRLLFLSATPLVTSAADLHPTFSIMRPGEWGSYAEFKEQFCQKKYDPFSPTGFKYVGIKNGTVLRQRARDFVFSAKKKNILKQLPPKRIIDLPLDIGSCEQFEGMDVAEMIDNILDGADEDAGFTTERERIGFEKIPAVLELIETFDASEPFVIFTYHRSVAMELAEKLDCSCILGGMSEKHRMQIVKDFMEGEITQLVISIGAGGLGLNLQIASIAIFAELPYSYSEFEQCSDRIFRIGSKKPVRIYKLVAVNSIDEKINESIEVKRLAAEDAGVAT